MGHHGGWRLPSFHHALECPGCGLCVTALPTPQLVVIGVVGADLPLHPRVPQEESHIPSIHGENRFPAYSNLLEAKAALLLCSSAFLGR